MGESSGTTCSHKIYIALVQKSVKFYVVSLNATVTRFDEAMHLNLVSPPSVIPGAQKH